MNKESSAARFNYFSQLGFKMRRALILHKKFGLWDRNEKGDTWKNVSKHCLVATARGMQFAELLQFTPEETDNLAQGLAVHDFYKQQEVQLRKKEGASQKTDRKASQLAVEALKENGVAEEVIQIAGATGISSSDIAKMAEILEKDDPSNFELSLLIAHLVDSYSIDDQWVTCVVDNTNQLDKRVTHNKSKYPEANHPTDEFPDETIFQTQRRFGHEIEEFLSRQICKKSGMDVPPLELPEYIDDMIRQKIVNTSS